DVMEDCGVLKRIEKREKVGYKMLIDGRIQSIPSQLNFLELLVAAPRVVTLKKQDRSMKSYYSGIIGKKNYEKVFGPLLSAVISQDADDFPAEVLFKKRPRRKDVLKSFTVSGGLQTITDALGACRGVEVLTGSEVAGITFSKDSFSLATREGKNYEARSLALATTATAAAALLETAFPQVSRLLKQIRVAVSEAVGFAVRKDALSLAPLAGIIPVHDSFFSVVSRDAIAHETYRGFTFHFKPGLLDREKKIGRISEVIGVKREQLEQVTVTENYVPFLNVGHDRLLGEIDSLLANKRLLLTGNYLLGLAIEDCVLRSLSEFSRLRALL
ncbi:MAG TPA: FAD-dependent oxidoreductase, partial [Thermodesulfovibrionales bacterium]|nr:FAD-dependent oxidoreductase [Thermodesulfovibrionales bacterium]